MADTKDRLALKAGAWYTISNFLTRGIGFLTTPLFTRMLTKEEFGAVSNYSSWVSILMVFAALNLHATLISARYDYKDRLDEYIASVLALSMISSAVWMLVFLFLHDAVTAVTGIESAYLILMGLYIMFTSALNFYQSREMYGFRYKNSVCLSLLISCGGSFLSAGLVAVMKDKLMGRVLGISLPVILAGCFLSVYLLKKGGRIDRDAWKYALPLSLPYIPHTLSLTVLNSMDKVMINQMCGAQDTAVYTIGYNCAAVITMIGSSINSAYGPWLSEKLSNGEFVQIRKKSKIYMLGFFLLASAVLLFAPEIVFILGGKQYMDAVYVTAPAALGCICQFFYSMFVSAEQFYKKTKGMAAATVTAAGINVVLNALFIPRMGYLAAAYTTLAGYLLLLLMHMFLVYKIRKPGIYSFRFTILLVCFGGAMAAGVSFLYKEFIVRYLTAGGMVILSAWFLVKNRNRIFQ